MIDRQIPQERLELLWILAYGAALLFILRLVNLQVLNAAHYREIAEKNRRSMTSQLEWMIEQEWSRCPQPPTPTGAASAFATKAREG